VRGCALPLERQRQVFVCPRGHTFDVSRHGYVNLLQPQDRRSRVAGDSPTAVAARARLAAAGIGRQITDAVVARAASLDLPDGAVAADLGSGTGDTLADVCRDLTIDGLGFDLSRAAVQHAARRFPDLTWAVANADRRLPLLDACVDLVVSVHARRNPEECARVLTPRGFLLVAVPAHDDLIELRRWVQGTATERDRAQAVLSDHERHFTRVDQSPVREHRPLTRELLLDVLRATYRGGRASAAAQVAILQTLNVTFASEIFVFAKH
jgi:23S rRNA (guanine745-N1)-methyltransferase